MNKTQTFLFIFAASPLLIASALAESTSTEISLGLAERVSNTYTWALGIGGMVALGIIIFGGVLYSASGGNPSRIDEAKKWIQHALFGLALLLSSYLLLNFINPDLTRLEEIFLEPNPQVAGTTLEGLPGGGVAVGECEEEDLKMARNTPNYGGPKCVKDGKPFYNSKRAPVGNFGDLLCERPFSRPAFAEQIRNAVREDLERYTAGDKSYCGINIIRLTRIMTDVVAKGESGYNPNAYNECSTSGRGAFGLFQMNPVRSKNPKNPNARDDVPYDRGDVPWREQVTSAILKLISDGGEGYWAQWPGAMAKKPWVKLLPCTQQTAI